MDDVTRMLEAVRRGETAAAEELFPVAYAELRRMAAARLSGEKAGGTLQATALVHEAYLRLAGPAGGLGAWDSPAHFFGAAAEAMRRVLIDRARRKAAAKRGAGAAHTELDNDRIGSTPPSAELLAVDEALGKLTEESPDLAAVVKLRYFAGLTVPEVAAVLGVSPSTVDRDWRCARAWLYREISGMEP